MTGKFIVYCSAVVVGVLLTSCGENAPKPPSVPLDVKLQSHVAVITSTQKPRNFQNVEALNETARYISKQFEDAGLSASAQVFTVDGKQYRNVIGMVGNGDEIVVIGAHYDVCGNQPGADDNASAVAALIELAYHFGVMRSELNCQMVFVGYALEEPPFFRTEHMGSYHHAKSLFDSKCKVRYMICLESIGYYSDTPNSQRYPIPGLEKLYPDTGNFIAVIGNMKSAALVSSVYEAIKQENRIPCQQLAAPTALKGVDFSDHMNYWRFGYQAVMVTDTAMFRNPAYHKTGDTPSTLDYQKMAAVTEEIATFLQSSCRTAVPAQ